MNNPEFFRKNAVEEHVHNALYGSFRDSRQVLDFIDLIEPTAGSYLLKHLDALAVIIKEEEEDLYSSEEFEEHDDQVLLRSQQYFEARLAEEKPELDRKQKLFESCAELPKCFGTIWLLEQKGLDEKYPVPDTVLLVSTPKEGERTAQAIPLHDWSALAMDGDLVFPSCDYHSDLVLPLWNEQPVAVSRLETCVGRLLEDELDVLAEALLSEERDEEKSHSLQFLIDPRYAYQEFQIAATAPLRGEALMLLHEEEEEVAVLCNVLEVIERFEARSKVQKRPEMLPLSEGLAARGDTEVPQKGIMLYSDMPEYSFFLSRISEKEWQLELDMGSPEEMEGAAIMAKDHGELAIMVKGKAIFSLGSATEICLRMTDGTWVEGKMSDV
ncbi:MAG: hypothetical protein GX130_06665 [Candidatus Hydrogenedens sp.]|nr:hypothetical protein [Candidatus Hydrogenedens sp.]